MSQVPHKFPFVLGQNIVARSLTEATLHLMLLKLHVKQIAGSSEVGLLSVK